MKLKVMSFVFAVVMFASISAPAATINACCDGSSCCDSSSCCQ